MSNPDTKNIKTFIFAAVLAVSTAWPQMALAVEIGDLGTNISTIAESITKSLEDIPFLVSNIGYLIALALGVWGILKLKDHIENPQQTRVSEGITRLVAGGALLSLPTLYEAMKKTIGEGGQDLSSTSIMGNLSGILDTVSGFLPSQNINQILGAMGAAISDIPGLIGAAAYLIAIILGIWGVLNIKDNIESGQNNPPIREGITRLLIGGALFALPTVFEALQNSIGNPDTLDSIADGASEAVGISSIVAGGGGMSCSPAQMASGAGGVVADAAAAGVDALGGPDIGAEGTLGTVICSSVFSTITIPAFIFSVAYLMGFVLGVWGIFKLRDYAINPQQTQAWDFISRFAASGAFFTLPMVVRAVQNSLGASAFLMPHGPGSVQGEAGEGGGLDAMLINLVSDVAGPASAVINWFGYVAGAILIFIGVSRLLKSSQEGARGPGGIGTIMTFVVGGALMSFSQIVASVGVSMFSGAGMETKTFAVMNDASVAEAMSEEARAQVSTVMSSVLVFMMIVGYVSIMRGLFLVRDVGEGSQQASMMAALSHIIGGGIAVNLGTFITYVQTTLGISGIGPGFEAIDNGGLFSTVTDLSPF